MRDDEYTGALLEDINSKLQGIAEAVGGLNEWRSTTDQRLIVIEENTNLIPAIRQAVTHQSTEQSDHAARLARLEAA